MNTVLLAGAGQLGSRHLQGLKKANAELDIWVFDLSKEALAVAEERYNQVEETSTKNVHFVQTLEDVPTKIDVVVNATGSKPRAAIVENILSTKSVKYMILEKFLFGKLSDYEKIGDILSEKNVKTWVNCPFKLYSGYQQLKKLLDYTSPISMTFAGENWGLCCNAIHYIDIFMYLSESSDFTLDMSEIENRVIDSKRPGYVELLGSLKIRTPKGDCLNLISNETCDAAYTIVNAGKKYLVSEGENTIKIDDTIMSLGLEYQSNLTGVVVDQLLTQGTCNLSTYNLSAGYHKKFLAEVAPFINKIKGWENDSCPIT